jgi:hypothetical protein
MSQRRRPELPWVPAGPAGASIIVSDGRGVGNNSRPRRSQHHRKSWPANQAVVVIKQRVRHEETKNVHGEPVAPVRNKFGALDGGRANTKKPAETVGDPGQGGKPQHSSPKVAAARGKRRNEMHLACANSGGDKGRLVSPQPTTGMGGEKAQATHELGKGVGPPWMQHIVTGAQPATKQPCGDEHKRVESAHLEVSVACMAPQVVLAGKPRRKECAPGKNGGQPLVHPEAGAMERPWHTRGPGRWRLVAGAQPRRSLAQANKHSRAPETPAHPAHKHRTQHKEAMSKVCGRRIGKAIRAAAPQRRARAHGGNAVGSAIRPMARQGGRGMPHPRVASRWCSGGHEMLSRDKASRHAGSDGDHSKQQQQADKGRRQVTHITAIMHDVAVTGCSND